MECDGEIKKAGIFAPIIILMEHSEKFNFLFNYKRLQTSEVLVGNLPLGAANPIRIQSMTNTDTRDVEATIRQCIRVIEKGSDYVRITVPSLKDVDYIEDIRKNLNERGYNNPLIADVHFNPEIAEQVAKIVEKVRINPGNYSGNLKNENYEYSEDRYSNELLLVKEKFKKLISICKENNNAIRIGVNHGSLSNRIISRYGDTPLGMAESAMEFIRICREESFKNVVISMKSSNTMVMVQATRLITEMMKKENILFPLHLGVTEAGEGEDGRIKSAAGIGVLLLDGIGDTIRVSLTENPEEEIPVAKKIVDYIEEKKQLQKVQEVLLKNISPFEYKRRHSYNIESIGNKKTPIVIADFSGKKCTADLLKEIGWIYKEDGTWSFSDQAADCIFISEIPDIHLPDEKIKIVSNSLLKKWENKPPKTFALINAEEYLADENSEKLRFLEVNCDDFSKSIIEKLKNDRNIIVIAEADDKNSIYGQRSIIFKLLAHDLNNPVILKNNYQEDIEEDLQIKTSIDTGGFFIDGLSDGIWLCNDGDITRNKINSIAFGILQATRSRITKTEYISCPSCGRTNFNIMETAAAIRLRTNHLKGLKIGIMGCIVNGIGEMADADYGYVGAGKGKVTLYKAREVKKKNVPEAEAVDELINLIKENGDWIERI